MMNATDFKEACKHIKLLLFDCDGVLTDGRIVLGTGAEEMKFFSTRDGIGMNLWHKAGHTCGAITGRTSEALSRRARELAFDELHQGISSKGKIIAEITARRGLSPHETAFVGDDLNDLSAKKFIGLFFAPADAHEIVKLHADYILGTPGGQGAVREAVDLILRCQGRLEALVEQYLA